MLNDVRDSLEVNYLDRKEVCEYLKISQATLMKLRKEGLICYRVGGNLRFIKSEVDDFVRNRKA